MKKSAKPKRGRPVRPPTSSAAASRGATIRQRLGGLLQRHWYVLLIFALGLLIYRPALSGPFVLDDYDLAEANSAMRTAEPGSIIRSGRPLLMLTYIFNYQLSGFEPFSFHLTNVLLHCLNAWLLWRFLATLFAPGRLEDLIPSAARPVLIHGVPLLFLASPVQTESVAYVSSRSELLATSFYLGALWLFASRLRTERPWLTAFLTLLLLACAASSKQDKLTLPFAVALLDYMLLSQLDWRGMKRSWPTYSLFVAGIVIGFFLVVRPQLFAISAGFRLDWQQYLFTQFRMYFLYIRLILFPFGLNADYNITPSATLLEHLSWLGLLGVISLTAGAVRYRRQAPLISFGTLFFLLTLAPTSSFFPIMDYAAERRLYLPMVGLLLALTVGLIRWFRPSLRAAGAVLAGVLVVYSAGTFQRSRVWADELTLWQDTVTKSPGKYRAWTWLGRAYNDRGAYTKAIQAWERAEELVPKGTRDHAHLLNNLALAYANLNDRTTAVEYYEKALEIRPKHAMFRANYAVTLRRLGRDEKAWENFQIAVRQGRNRPGVFRLRGQELFQARRYEEAAEDFRRVLELRPEDEVAQRNLEAAEAMLRRSQRR